MDKAYAAAMREAARQFPDDLDVQTLFAESLMDTMPWDYWLKDRSPKPETDEALRALKFVLSRNPDHPGANHFYIHAVEAGPTPEAGLPSADRLRDYAPLAGHLVHMPSHIYIRTGQYSDAVLANVKAVKADRDYLRQTRAQGFYPGVYYPHNIHFLWWALLYEGRSREALKAARDAAIYAVENYCGPAKVLEAPRFRHLPWLTLLRFGKAKEILAVPMPAATNDFLIDRAVWHFVRGLAFVSQKDAEAAMRESQALAGIARSEDLKKLENPQFPATSVVAVAEHWLAGRAAEAGGPTGKSRANLSRRSAQDAAQRLGAAGIGKRVARAKPLRRSRSGVAPVRRDLEECRYGARLELVLDLSPIRTRTLPARGRDHSGNGWSLVSGMKAITSRPSRNTTPSKVTANRRSIPGIAFNWPEK